MMRGREGLERYLYNQGVKQTLRNILAFQLHRNIHVLKYLFIENSLVALSLLDNNLRISDLWTVLVFAKFIGCS
jgi:hypothetical protein